MTIPVTVPPKLALDVELLTLIEVGINDGAGEGFDGEDVGIDRVGLFEGLKGEFVGLFVRFKGEYVGLIVGLSGE